MNETREKIHMQFCAHEYHLRAHHRLSTAVISPFFLPVLAQATGGELLCAHRTALLCFQASQRAMRDQTTAFFVC